MVQKVSLADKVRDREQKEVNSRPSRINAVNRIAIDDKAKDKQISAKVNERVYHMFTQINKAQGMSNNSALNLIINKYVRENKELLEDDI